jgi:hypothetical protein
LTLILIKSLAFCCLCRLFSYTVLLPRVIHTVVLLGFTCLKCGMRSHCADIPEHSILSHWIEFGVFPGFFFFCRCFWCSPADSYTIRRWGQYFHNFWLIWKKSRNRHSYVKITGGPI